MDDNQRACLGFSLCGGFGPITFKKLVSHYSSPSKAFSAPESQLFKLVKETQARKLIAFRSKFKAEDEIKKLHSKNIWVVACIEKSYPQQLLELYDPPICLFGKGKISLFDFLTDSYVGIVGTRKATSYGLQMTKWISSTLSSQGVVIVSGMATGIDIIAHKAAIEKQARTIAVLGTGIDIIYPYENKALYEQIIREYGIIISEYPPGFGTNPGMFVLRNRIIVGISKAIVVVEGGKHSGTLTTARYAAENGRDVYAVPGPITSEMSVGPHILLREGAKVLSDPQELLHDFGLNPPSHSLEKMPADLTEQEKEVYDLLSVRKYTVDEVAKKMSVRISDLLPILSLLEVRGIIGKELDGQFTVRV